MATSNVTVGIDIGTSSVKAVAADDDGNVVARSRIPHAFHVPSPQRFEHDAGIAWHDGPQQALDALGDVDPRAVSVAAMVPSLTAVDEAGKPLTPGLLYGDERGHQAERSAQPERAELAAFLRWQAQERPGRTWILDGASRRESCAVRPSEHFVHRRCDRRDAVQLERVGHHAARRLRSPRRSDAGGPTTRPAVADVTGRKNCVLEGGSVDAFAEQLVAGASYGRRRLVILGTTLIVWTVVPEAVDVKGYYTMPNTAAGTYLVGGPSNAGGLFLNWATRVASADAAPRTSIRHASRCGCPTRAVSVSRYKTRTGGASSSISTSPTGRQPRGAARWKPTAFAARRMIAASPVPATRIVATGGGTRLDGWVEALADCTGLPVHVCAIPEGGALGAAFLARLACGLETSMTDATRWARTARVVDPLPRWQPHVDARYERFCDAAG